MSKKEDQWMDRFPGGTESPRPSEPVRPHNAHNARQRMIERQNSDDRRLPKNSYQAELDKRRESGELFPQ